MTRSGVGGVGPHALGVGPHALGVELYESRCSESSVALEGAHGGAV